MAALAQKARKGKLTKKQRVARANAEGEKKRGNTRPQRMKRIKDKDEKERAWMARPHRFVNEMGPVYV